MQYVNGGFIGRNLEIRPDDSRSLSGVWNINEHFDMRYQGMLPAPTYNWDNNTILCLKGGGVEGSTKIVDATGKQIVINYGDTIRYSSAQTKYATTSIYFDGSSSLMILSSSLTNFFSGSYTGNENVNYTIEWWEYLLPGWSTTHTAFVSEVKPLSYCGLMCGYATGSTGRLFYMSSTGATWAISALSMGGYTASVWKHRAISRSGSTFRTFEDGVLKNSTTSTLSSFKKETNLMIGAYMPAQEFKRTNYYGYMEDFTITKFPKYSASFTVVEVTN